MNARATSGNEYSDLQIGMECLSIVGAEGQASPKSVMRAIERFEPQATQIILAATAQVLGLHMSCEEKTALIQEIVDATLVQLENNNAAALLRAA